MHFICILNIVYIFLPEILFYVRDAVTFLNTSWNHVLYINLATRSIFDFCIRSESLFRNAILNRAKQTVEQHLYEQYPVNSVGGTTYHRGMLPEFIYFLFVFQCLFEYLLIRNELIFQEKFANWSLFLLLFSLKHKNICLKLIIFL